MLQLFHSLHTYACYYALLCFLFHQQPFAASITIIIDGATTNEWATRDEYQRLVDSSQGPVALGAANQRPQPQDAPLGVGGPPAAARFSDSPAERQRPRAHLAPDQQAAESRLAPDYQAQLVYPGSRGSGASAAPLADLGQGQLRQQELQQQQQLELELELLERQQVRQRDQLQQEQLQQELELVQQFQRQQQQAPSPPQPQPQPPQPQAQLNYLAPGARTINDLVSQGDEDLDDPLRRLKERGSSPKHYCGNQLIDVLDLVCEGRYYGGDLGGPTIVNPTVKSKRDTQAAALSGDEPGGQPRSGAKLASGPAAGLGRSRKRSNIFSASPPAFGLGFGRDQHRASDDTMRRRNVNDNDDNNSATKSNKNNINDNVNSSKNNNHHDRSTTTNNNNNNINDNNNNNSNNNHDDNNNNNSNNSNNDNDDSNENDNMMLKQQKRDTYANLMSQNRNNKHSKMSRYRLIRGVTSQCCTNSCYLEDLKAYCQK